MNITEDDIAKTHIDTVACLVRILAHKRVDQRGMIFNKEILVNNDELSWIPYDEQYTGYLSLDEIAAQLTKKVYISPFIVWEELGLSGSIYMYGNYAPAVWVKHGTTKGYA